MHKPQQWELNKSSYFYYKHSIDIKPYLTVLYFTNPCTNNNQQIHQKVILEHGYWQKIIERQILFDPDRDRATVQMSMYLRGKQCTWTF